MFGRATIRLGIGPHSSLGIDLLTNRYSTIYWFVQYLFHIVNATVLSSAVIRSALSYIICRRNVRIVRFCALKILRRLGQLARNWLFCAELTKPHGNCKILQILFSSIAVSSALMSDDYQSQHKAFRCKSEWQNIWLFCAFNADVTSVTISNCNKFCVR